ncbi:uncharacterized protein C2845_PM17G06740 [Panicum miliaceum]|uniref:Replication protein A 70 kDa DNA-binding subunit B/D first OB fold domain-containing protein n=1 Tax=Panicum miliaceum TaxID=4540 RepID=A0A3L6Q2H2_PANMI|nr:uncharacterized protein C2845_PM17G06740 [Panicum miliaceum]
MEYNLLSQINPTRHNWRIKVGISRMWQVSGTSKGKDFSSLELVIVDEEGQGITGSIGQKDLNKFLKSVVEGHCYYIRNIQVSKQERKFKAIPSTYTIFFTSWTIIEDIRAEVSANIPHYIFNFVDYDDLDHRARHGQGLIDIIGQLTVVHLVVHSSSLNAPSVRGEVELRDLSDKLLSVTLWDEHATSFEDEILIETIRNDEPVVIVFAGMQVLLDAGAILQQNVYKEEALKFCSYQAMVMLQQDATGHTKIFMFGGVAEQIVPRTAAELVEESSSNQILLPGALRALVGRNYVFQVVISEQTFRTGQLCFQGRKVFMPPRIQGGGANVTLKDIPKKDPAATASTGPSSTTPDKEPSDGRSASLTENSIDPGDESTPPPSSQTPTPEKKSSTKGKEAVSPSAREEHGNVLGKRSRTARKELLYSKKEKTSEE